MSAEDLHKLVFRPAADPIVLPGVNYMDRHSCSTYHLSGERFPQLPRPERDVAIALLRYALEQLEAQQ